MTKSELIILNLTEIRRRSVMLWNTLPTELYQWKPDPKAMSAIEMIRHVLAADHGWNIIIQNGNMTSYTSPWQGVPFMSVSEEIEFAEPYRKEFIQTIAQFSDQALDESEIIHPGNGKKKNLTKYLLRIGYHESVHAGQFLSYLRSMKVDRPNIWD